jgi:drug/metabolite transporter (DMT)-like permease
VPPSSGSSPERRLALACLAIAVVGWGFNWPIIKVLLREWPPLFARGTSGLCGAAALALAAVAAGESLKLPRGIGLRLAWASFTNVFAWMGFSTIGLLWLDVAEAALLVYTMPIWAMILAWPIAGERPQARQVAALVLSFVGVVVLLAGGGVGLNSAKWPGILLMLTSAILFALGAATSRTPLPLAPVVSTAWQVGLGCLPMVILGLVFERDRIGGLGPEAWAAWAYMAFVPMGLCYLTWFVAVRGLGAASASLGMLLAPVVGVTSAAWALGEEFGPRQILALTLTLGGVALALRRQDG